jgi:uncharacterized protein YggE
MFRVARLAACVAALASSVCASVQTAQGPVEPTIAVNGTGRVERTPDYVEVMLGVDVLDPVAATAQGSAEKAMGAVVAAVRALSLDGVELRPGTVELRPQYGDAQRDELPRIIGHRASMSLLVRTADLSSPARVIDAAMKTGATRVDSVEFGIREALEAREEAIRLASKAAKRKAAVLAESLDVKLGRIVSAGTSAGVYPLASNRYSNMQAQMASPRGGGEEGEGAIVPGKVEVWAVVNVTYGIGE